MCTVWRGCSNIAMSADVRVSFADRSRPWRLALAVMGGVWAAVILPLPASAEGDWSWLWITDIYEYPVYRAAREWASDPYIVFGALSAISFLMIGLALFPDLNRAGLGGRIMAWTTLAGAPMVVLSYLTAPATSPLHFLWGDDLFVLLAIGLSGMVAAWTAGRIWKAWVRVLLGATLAVLTLGVLAFGYWPHGSLIFLAVEAAAIIAAAPRDSTPRAHA